MECPSHPAPGVAGSVPEEGFRLTDGSIRFLAGLSLAALAAITGIVSYLHALTVVHLTGSAGVVAYLIPFVADLMIVTASLAILDAIRHRARKPPLAMVSLVTGISSTLGMNIVAGLAHQRRRSPGRRTASSGIRALPGNPDGHRPAGMWRRRCEPRRDHRWPVPAQRGHVG